MDIINVILLIGLVILVIVAEIQKYRQERGKWEKKPLKLDEFCEKHYKKIWIIFVLIFIVTVVYKFGELPTHISVDEVAGAYDATNIANYGVGRYLDSYPIYIPNFGGGQSALWCYLAVICVKLFGSNIVSYRLPFLLMYMITIIVSYLLVSKSKNKKMALLFTFLIMTCPWNITNTRKALDCNLYGGMLMVNLFLMNRAKKNYQYVLAGISVGITLYTYCLSWITMPIFIAVWAIYMLYMKKLKMKQLILFGIPVIIIAIPLFYFLLLNYGFFEQTQFGIFTVPKLTEFRSNEIGLVNIWKRGLESLKIIFLNKDTIYLMYVPLFVIGYISSVKEMIQNTKKKEYSVTSLMVIAFTTIFIGLMIAGVPTPNKANALYIPILYFVMIGILKTFKNAKTLFIMCMILVCISFICFEYRYYTNDAYNLERIAIYDDNSFYKIVGKLEANEETANMVKRVCIIKNEAYMYQLFATQMSPYEYNEKEVKQMIKGKERTTRLGNYYYYHIAYSLEDFLKESFKNQNEIIIISNMLMTLVEQQENIEQYEKIEYKDVYILVGKEFADSLKSILQEK